MYRYVHVAHYFLSGLTQATVTHMQSGETFDTEQTSKTLTPSLTPNCFVNEVSLIGIFQFLFNPNHILIKSSNMSYLFIKDQRCDATHLIEPVHSMTSLVDMKSGSVIRIPGPQKKRYKLVATFAEYKILK